MKKIKQKIVAAVMLLGVSQFGMADSSVSSAIEKLKQSKPVIEGLEKFDNFNKECVVDRDVYQALKMKSAKNDVFPDKLMANLKQQYEMKDSLDKLTEESCVKHTYFWKEQHHRLKSLGLRLSDSYIETCQNMVNFAGQNLVYLDAPGGYSYEEVLQKMMGTMDEAYLNEVHMALIKDEAFLTIQIRNFMERLPLIYALAGVCESDPEFVKRVELNFDTWEIPLKEGESVEACMRTLFFNS